MRSDQNFLFSRQSLAISTSYTVAPHRALQTEQNSHKRFYRSRSTFELCAECLYLFHIHVVWHAFSGHLRDFLFQCFLVTSSRFFRNTVPFLCVLFQLGSSKNWPSRVRVGASRFSLFAGRSYFFTAQNFEFQPFIQTKQKPLLILSFFFFFRFSCPRL